MPEAVNIDIIGAVISPVKPDNSPWDPSTATVDPNDLAAVSAALKATVGAYALVFDIMTSPTFMSASSVLSKPDVSGSAEISQVGGGFGQPLLLPKVSDQHFPVWNDPIQGWLSVPVVDQLMVQISLEDEDLWPNADDPIGVVRLNKADVRNAWEAGGTFRAQVNNQGNGEILFVSIAVTSACDPGHCSNGIQDCDETAINCGGADCSACGGGCGDVAYAHQGTCDPAFINACDGCDLGCEVHDPDCNGSSFLSVCTCLAGDSTWYCDAFDDCTECGCECDVGADAICS